MNKIYVIGPLAALAVFAGYTVHFNKGYEEHEALKAAEAKAFREAKLKAENEARKKAMEDAVATQQRLKKERADKEAEEARKKESRQAAIDARDRSFREQEKLARQIERLKKDVKNEQEVIAKLEGSIKYNQAEKAFLNEFVVKAQQNITSLAEVLTKIETAEAARTAAAAQSEKSKS